jgi:hypothetical protein
LIRIVKLNNLIKSGNEIVLRWHDSGDLLSERRAKAIMEGKKEE